MSKPFDYSKWDNIELSDDEDDLHPNIEKESWFRMKHRSRVEREDNEEKDKKMLLNEMEKANQRIKVLEHDLKKLKAQQQQDDDDDDDDLDDREGLETELNELKKANAERQKKLDGFEKHKKWNVDNMFHVKEERTIVNPKAAKESYTSTGFVAEDEVEESAPTAEKKIAATTKSPAPEKEVPAAAKAKTAAKETVGDTEVDKITASTSSASMDKPPTPPVGPTQDLGTMETYHEFTQKHADTVEDFMKCKTLNESKEFLLQHANTLLQENASNYLLLASLEDEMNGYREKMKLTARQSQIITNIAELAKTLKTHPGNVIQPFFQRLTERPHLVEFLNGVNIFVDKIIKRAVVKKAEMEEAQRAEEQASDLHDIPKEERLGPGGLDPLEVIETLPQAVVDAFESRNVDQLREALAQMDPEEAEYHMKRCIDSGLWVANS